MNELDAGAAWDWCVREYERPGAAERLLRAQDEAGLDVMQHLFLRWLAEDRGIELTATVQEELAQSVQAWRLEVVQALRHIRRTIKAKPAPGAGSQSEWDAVRELIGRAELRAEKAQLVMMCEWMVVCPGRKPSP